MKKEINSKAKRKWIMGGLAAFASIAMLTTGFAVWVVGVQQNEQSKDVGVTVDTATNASLTLNMVLSDSSIVLAEPEEVSGDHFVSASGEEVVANPLQISFSKIEIKYGKQSTLQPTKIEFSIDEGTKEDPKTSVKVTDSKLVGDQKRSGTGWTYLEAPGEITLPKQGDPEFKNDDKGTTITLSGKTIDFKWGTFFDGKSPCEYYNSLFNKKADQTYENTLLVQQELDGMYKALNGNQITLKAELIA
jgi:hypothetical protein